MDLKRCFKCSESKPRSEFYRHPMMGDGLLGKCKECTKKDVKENRKKKPNYYRAYDVARFRDDQDRRKAASEYQRVSRKRCPEKWAARNAISNAVRDGRVTRMPCEVCGDEKSEAHHPDYSKPLDVQWLCFKHHRKIHGQLEDIE